MQAATLPGEWKEEQYERSRKVRSLKLPETQERFVHPDGPGKPVNGKLWFEGDGKQKLVTEQEERKEAERIYRKKHFDPNRLGPRDFRKGDKWLPFHFKPETLS
jgi:hypothetical protein